MPACSWGVPYETALFASASIGCASVRFPIVVRLGACVVSVFWEVEVAALVVVEVAALADREFLVEVAARYLEK